MKTEIKREGAKSGRDRRGQKIGKEKGGR